MPNGILSATNSAINSNIKQHLYSDDKHLMNGTLKRQPDKSNKNDEQAQQQKQQQQHQQSTNNILNVAEMLLHGVADKEILEIWLTSITCDEFVSNFLDAGYDMPTISRVTPQDLTAIGVTDPTKRSKIITEIKKLNLQDGIPDFRPASLSHWLTLLRLDKNYCKSLCDQNIDTIDKVCQLTWEDFEELGITKLGHQKRLQLAIERINDLNAADLKASSKPISEPIYDTNSSQILLVASSENHSMNGPIINKQSSTSELSSTGSGSMQSIYSASSHHQQSATHAVHQANSNNISSNTVASSRHTQQQQQQKQPQQQIQTQAIYSQPPPQLFQQPNQVAQLYQPSLPQPPPLPPPNLLAQQQNNSQLTPVYNPTTSSQAQSFSHYQSAHTQLGNLSLLDDSFRQRMLGVDSNIHNNVVPQQQQQHYQTNRQSLGQLPFALANLPKHQQQLLQQSSIYATLSRQPQRSKQPPPPVPIRTNSLKSNSLIDEDDNRQRNEQLLRNSMNANLYSPHRQQQQQQRQQQLLGDGSNTTLTADSLFRGGSRITSRAGFYGAQTLQKNKSFSGNAYMDAARARFLNRNYSQPQPQLYSACNLNAPSSQPQNSTNGTAGVTAHDMANANLGNNNFNNNNNYHATTGRDDDFPPPPSPLSLTDYDAIMPCNARATLELGRRCR